MKKYSLSHKGLGYKNWLFFLLEYNHDFVLTLYMVLKSEMLRNPIYQSFVYKTLSSKA